MTADQAWNLIWAAIGQIMGYITTLAGWAFVLLVAAKVAQMYGIRLPIPVINDTALLYTAGAWYLIRK